jgi:hypothetical protein
MIMKAALAKFRLPLAVAGLLLALTVIYAFLPLFAPPRFASPDESSNRFFAALFAERGMLYHFDALNLLVDGRVRPRSTRFVDEFVVPGGFLGMPVLYGGIAKAFGVAVLPFLTPLVAALGVLGWWLLLRKIFGEKVAAFGALLLAAHPAWWYAASRTFQPNVLFASLAIWAAWFLLAAPIRTALAGRDGLPLLRNADAPIAGVLFGLALAVRTSEAYWIAPAALAAIVALRGKAPWARLCLFACFVALTLAPFLFLNDSLYGHWLSTGYGSAPTSVPTASVPQGGGSRLLGPLRPILFPLGFAPRTAFANAVTYGFGFFSWWSVLVVAALAWFGVAATRMRRSKQAARPASVAAIAFAVIATLWLVLFYGSWTVQDNPDASAVTIGSSYLRYWLPLFLSSIVLVAWAAKDALDRLPKPAFRPRIIAAALAAYATLATWSVFAAPQEGLLALRRTLIAQDAVAKGVVAKTEDKALIVVDRADKILFPERRVMLPLRDEGTYAALAKLKPSAPLYYFGITFPEGDLQWLRETKLPPLGLGIEPVETFGEETLYRFTVTPQP